MSGNKAVVISIDAMTGEDLKELGKRKNTASLLSSAAIVENIHCVYPTYTYPCHAAIVTGCYPDRNGIFHNEILDITKDENDWFWWGKYHKKKTVIDLANENGLITASCGWPTLAGGNAKYTIPEIWPTRNTPDPEEMYRKAVSSEAWPVFERNRHYLEDTTKPFYDLFTLFSATEILEKYRPDLMLIHLSDIDHKKHERGSSPLVLTDAYDFIDEALGKIIEALKEAGTYDETTFFLLGDHGQMDVKRVFSINRVLLEKGYITAENGKIKDYRIICHPASFSSPVFLKGISEKEALRVFREIQEEYPQAISRIMTNFEAEEIHHLSGPFSLVLESSDGLIFSYSPFLPVLMERKEADKHKISYSTHGYAPERGPKPPFAVTGKRAVNGKRIPWARMVDEAPTILSLFGIRMEDIDGKVIEGLLN